MLHFKKIITILGILGALATEAFAAGNLSSMTQHITEQMNALVSLFSVIAYVSGVGFAMTGLLQLKGHKDNPQQIPLSKPVVMLIVATCLLFLPTIMGTAGMSLFGEHAISSAIAGGSRDLSGL